MASDRDAAFGGGLATTAPNLGAHGSDSLILPGVELSRFVVRRRLGSGGMGVVYLAHDPTLERDVAVKLLHPEASHSDALQERLIREAKALSKVVHPNVVTVHEVGIADRDVFIVMEYVAGVTLADWLGLRPRTRREILDVFVAAGSGLAAAHAAGVVHRDFKPQNVLVGTDGRVRVTDFGLAILPALSPEADAGVPGPRSPATFGLTETGARVGTPRYMPPEQHAGLADARSDQYAFCVALHEAICGQSPFPGATETELRAQVVAGNLRPPPARARVPAWLVRAIRRGLSAAPGERWPAMDDLLHELRRDRGRAVRQALWIVGILAMGAVTAVALVRPPRPSVCGGAAAKLAGVWDPGRQAAVRDAFVATGRAEARGTYDRVARRLDGYTAAWVAMREDACQATAVRHEQSETLLDRRMGCLDRRLGELTGVVSVLARGPDAAVLDGAVTIATGLEPLASCADAEALGSAVPPPGDPATRAAVATLYERVGQLHALDLAGKDDVAELRQAEEVVRDARRAGYTPVLAEALLQLAVEQQGVAAGAAAEATMHEALQAAARAHDDAKVAWILIFLIRSVGLTQGRPADALALRPVAEAAVIRAGDPPRLRGRLLHSIGTVEREKGQLAEAQAALEQAVVLLEADPERDDQMRADALNDLAIVLFMRGDQAGSQLRFERALELFESVLGPGHQKIGMGKGNLAEILRAQGKRREARAAMAGAREIFAAAEGADGPEVAQADRMLGDLDTELGEYAAARPELERALHSQLRRLGPDHPQVAQTLDAMAELDIKIGADADAEEAAGRALAIQEKTRGAEHPDVAGALRTLARAHLASGRPRDALPLVERARAIDEKAAGLEHETRAADLALRAEIIAALGRAQAALDDDALALAIREKATPDDLPVADSLTAVAGRELALGHAGAAAPLLERALKIQLGRTAPPDALARTRLALAQALWDMAADRGRARELAGAARDGYGTLGDPGAKGKADAERWLATRR